MNQPHSPQGPRRGSLLVLFLTVFVDLLGFGMVLPLLPLYADQYAVDPAGWKIGLLMACFSFMQFIFAPIWGMISDRFGRRPVIMVGLAGSIVFYALFGYASIAKSLEWLFVSRIGAGIAGATIPTAQAYIADSTPGEKRTHGMVLIGMAMGLGFTFGPLFGLLALPSGVGDPGPWPGFAAAGLSAIALLMAIFLLPESRRPDGNATARKWLDIEGLRHALQKRSLLILLQAYFLAVFAFVMFETTLSMLIKGSGDDSTDPFNFTWPQICLTFAFIGFSLAIVQGAIIRPLSKRVSEQKLAITGMAVNIFGFLAIVLAVEQQSVPGLFVALLIVVSGFSAVQPSLSGLISRWTSQDKQGSVLGLSQSLNAMARIVGSAIGIPLLKMGATVPYGLSAVLIVISATIIVHAGRLRFHESPAD